MSTVLELLSAQESARQEEAERNYTDIVRRLAVGDDDPTLDEVQDVLEAIGKTSSDLQRAVSTQRYINSRRAKIQASEEAELERKEIELKVAAAKAILDAAQQSYLATLRPLNFRISQINQLAMDAQTAESELLQANS